MRSNATRNGRAVVARRGVTLVEFVGCLAALGGGIVLGSIYLGVDVKAMALEILEKADIDIPAMLDDSGQTTKPSPAAETPTADTTVSQPVAIDNSSEEPAIEPQSEAATVDDTSAILSEKTELTDAEKRAATLACWLELNRCTREESAHRSKSIDDPESWHLFDYLLHRKEGHQQVVDAIEAIDQHGVEQRVRLHAQQLLAWHQTGVELYDRAAQLITDAPAGKLSGPFAQSWQSSATQHRMEEKLLLNKHAAVSTYLEHAQIRSHSSER